jgi:hypothetical protein
VSELEYVTSLETQYDQQGELLKTAFEMIDRLIAALNQANDRQERQNAVMAKLSERI